MKILFRNNWKSYLFILAFGILMGILAGLDARLPGDGLWAFGTWGSFALGFWLISTSIIVLASENRKTAVINTIIYIYSLFFVTAIFRLSDSYLLTYANKEAPITLFQYLTEWDSIKWYFSYAFELETILAVLASPILYFGRKDNLWGKIIRLLPLACIVFEFCAYGYQVITEHTLLFSTLIDLALIAIYIFFIKDSFKKPQPVAPSETTHS